MGETEDVVRDILVALLPVINEHDIRPAELCLALASIASCINKNIRNQAVDVVEEMLL